jgi:hypothetical protein
MWGQRLVEFIEKTVKAQSNMLKVCLIRVRGHHRNFCVGRGVEGVKAARNGPGGATSVVGSNQLPVCGWNTTNLLKEAIPKVVKEDKNLDTILEYTFRSLSGLSL